jgi:hypothetical protein
MQLLEEELHPLRRELEEGPTLRLLPETLTSTLSLFSNYNSGSASLLQSSSLVSIEVRRGVSIYRGGNLGEWRTSPCFLGTTCLPKGGSRPLLAHYEGQEAVAERPGAEPDPRPENRA